MHLFSRETRQDCFIVRPPAHCNRSEHSGNLNCFPERERQMGGGGGGGGETDRQTDRQREEKKLFLGF